MAVYSAARVAVSAPSAVSRAVTSARLLSARTAPAVRRLAGAAARASVPMPRPRLVTFERTTRVATASAWQRCRRLGTAMLRYVVSGRSSTPRRIVVAARVLGSCVLRCHRSLLSRDWCRAAACAVPPLVVVDVVVVVVVIAVVVAVVDVRCFVCAVQPSALPRPPSSELWGGTGTGVVSPAPFGSAPLPDVHVSELYGAMVSVYPCDCAS
jgi:hypothetical protein